MTCNKKGFVHLKKYSSSVTLTTFQVLNGHMWLVTPLFDSADLLIISITAESSVK